MQDIDSRTCPCEYQTRRAYQYLPQLATHILLHCCFHANCFLLILIFSYLIADACQTCPAHPQLQHHRLRMQVADARLLAHQAHLLFLCTHRKLSPTKCHRMLITRPLQDKGDDAPGIFFYNFSTLPFPFVPTMLTWFATRFWTVLRPSTTTAATPPPASHPLTTSSQQGRRGHP